MFLCALDWMALETMDNSACLFNFPVIKHCICILYCCTHGSTLNNKTFYLKEKISAYFMQYVVSCSVWCFHF